MGKRKYRIRRDRVFLLLVCPVALLCLAVTGIYHAAIGISSLFSGKDPAAGDSAVVRTLSKEMLLADRNMTGRIDSFMSQPMRLDKKDIGVT